MTRKERESSKWKDREGARVGRGQKRQVIKYPLLAQDASKKKTADLHEYHTPINEINK